MRKLTPEEKVEIAKGFKDLPRVKNVRINEISFYQVIVVMEDAEREDRSKVYRKEQDIYNTFPDTKFSFDVELTGEV